MSQIMGLPKKMLSKIYEPHHSKKRFLEKINKKGKLLDVGCGNNSPYYIKSKYPEIHYTGIDIGDYRQTAPNLADNYILAEPEKFAETIKGLPEDFDTVISSHNLEHCNDRDATLDAIIRVLRKEGLLYLSFPTEGSVNFPGPRNGTLNYFDDKTHKENPPSFSKVIDTLESSNMQIVFASKSYKPFFGYIIGLLQEPRSIKQKRAGYWTWCYWGFETIIWAKKK